MLIEAKKDPNIKQITSKVENQNIKMKKALFTMFTYLLLHISYKIHQQMLYNMSVSDT